MDYYRVIVATWNVNSITARLPSVLRWLESSKPDVLCMQETKCADDRFPSAELAELGYRSECFGQAAYNGVAILSREELASVCRGPSEEDLVQARLIGASVEGVNIVNAYIPNGASVGSEKYYFKLDWLRRLRTFFASGYRTDSPVLLCGDFNVAPEDRDVYDPRLWSGRILFSPAEREALEELRSWGFVDVFRLHNQESGQYSWWDYRAGSFRRNLGLRIDHIWMSPVLAERSVRAWIDREPRGWDRPSDHAPVLVEINW